VGVFGWHCFKFSVARKYKNPPGIVALLHTLVIGFQRVYLILMPFGTAEPGLL
jgi:hypothetical protein